MIMKIAKPQGEVLRTLGVIFPGTHMTSKLTAVPTLALALALATLSASEIHKQPALALAPAAKDKAAWKPLFDGKTLTGWKKTNFGGESEVSVKDGAIIMETGNDMTGITYARDDFPRMDYEVTLEGKKLKGNDFFCTTTFPVGDTFCSFVVGGWGGTVVGLSRVDLMDAVENETTQVKTFKQDQWYRVRIKVTKDKIEAWIDDDQLVDLKTKDKKITIRGECDASKPFGVATWRTAGAVRDIRVRTLSPMQKKKDATK